MNKTTESYGLGSRFKESSLLSIKMVCAWWIGVAICSLIFSFVGLSELSEWIEELLGYLIIGGTILQIIVTVWAYWFIRTDVLEFIDIKTSVSGTQTAMPQMVPVPPAEEGGGSSWLITLIGIVCILIVCGIAWYILSR